MVHHRLRRRGVRTDGARQQMQVAPSYYDRLAKAVDLNDPLEAPLAQKFMIEALRRVTAQLPEVAQRSAALANRFSTGVATFQEMEAERVMLWNSIEGRDLSPDQDVLRIRAAICVLYTNETANMAETLEYFFNFWLRGGLGVAELEAALHNNYRLF